MQRNGVLTSFIVEGTTVFDALQKGLDDLMDLCDVVTDKFATARDEFTRNRMGR